ncbi:MAG: LysR family transcriptional regulator [Acidobacteria bacterium]|nr:LysR family transcriptional regulator [Acidobacteriota bacterium]MBV9145615.1 LysR family transcriptional regulator [Acidobacteriota bacterium]MBV9437983.1 LysR family transcriptional regulator [Acidobacteriota bacterium]
MDIHQLEIFLSVLETGSVTRGAERVHLSPAAVSLQLQSLSQHLRTELFVRSGRKLAPTPMAFRLAELARGIAEQMRRIDSDFHAEPGEDTRPFHFATGVTTLVYRLGQPLRLLRKQYPRTELHVTVANTEEIVVGLLSRRFDLGLISLPVSEKSLATVPLFDEDLLVVRPSATRVRGGQIGSVRPADLAKVPWLLYPKESNMRLIIDGFFSRAGIEPHVVMEAADTEAIKRLVESGFGYSILPAFALKGQSRFFHTMRISGHRLVRSQALAMVNSAYPRPLTFKIAEFIRKSVQ